jgi:hypothetical protein
MVEVAPIITGIALASTFHVSLTSIMSLYFKITVIMYLFTVLFSLFKQRRSSPLRLQVSHGQLRVMIHV